MFSRRRAPGRTGQKGALAKRDSNPRFAATASLPIFSNSYTIGMIQEPVATTNRSLAGRRNCPASPPHVLAAASNGGKHCVRISFTVRRSLREHEGWCRGGGPLIEQKGSASTENNCNGYPGEPPTERFRFVKAQPASSRPPYNSRRCDWSGSAEPRVAASPRQPGEGPAV